MCTNICFVLLSEECKILDASLLTDVVLTSHSQQYLGLLFLLPSLTIIINAVNFIAIIIIVIISKISGLKQ